jgi:hypothetical protein
MPHDSTKQPTAPHPGKGAQPKKHPNENESAKEYESKQAPVPAEEGGRTANEQRKPATRIRR